MLKVICASHSPLLLHVEPIESVKGEKFFEAAERAHQLVVDYDPELVVVFAPDHFNGFFYDLMPQFCVGLEAVSTEDWDIQMGRMNVPADIGRALIDHLLKDDIDVAVSYDMKVDHGFTVALKLLTETLDAYPTLPIFINCAASPRASCRRSRMLGESVGRFLAKLDKRVLVIGSGGLSHDPPHAPLEQAPKEARDYLVGATPWTVEFEKARQARVIKASAELAKGNSPILQPDPEWDAVVLDVLTGQKLGEADNFTDKWITEVGGRGGHEIRAWIAAFAALGEQGKYEADVMYYDVIPDWATGMSIVSAGPS